MPHEAFPRLVASLDSARSLDDIHLTCSEICRSYNYDYFFYGMRIPTSLTKPQLVIISGYPPLWVKHYRDNNYFDLDPVLRHIQTDTRPFLWEYFAQMEVEAESRQFLEEARAFGLRAGITCNVNSPNGKSGFFSLASENDSDQGLAHIRKTSPFVFTLASHLHEAVQRTIEICEFTETVGGLTRRERECLLWAAEGKTSWETGAILGVSDETVTYHLRNAMGKMGVRTKHHAVARALTSGVLQKVYHQSSPCKEFIPTTME